MNQTLPKCYVCEDVTDEEELEEFSGLCMRCDKIKWDLYYEGRAMQGDSPQTTEERIEDE